MNEVIIFINNMLFNIGAFCLYWFLLKDQFKYSFKTVFLLFFGFSVIDRVAAIMEWNFILIALAVEISGRLFKIFMYKDNVINCFTLDYMSIMIANLFGNGAIILLAIINSFLHGGEVNWIVSTEISIGGYVFVNLVLLFGCWASYKLCMLVKEQILSLQGFAKYLFLICFIIPTIILGVVKGVSFQNYSFDPSGIIFFLDATTITIAIVGYAVFLIKNISAVKKENHLITDSMMSYEKTMSESAELHNMASELNHDIKNYLVSKGDADRELIENYCDEIIEKMED